MKWDLLVKNWFKRINFFLDPFPVVEEDNWSQSQRWKSPRAVTTFPRLATALQEIRDETGMEQAGEKETQTDDWKMVWGRAWMSWDSLIQKWKAHRSSSSAGCWGWIGFLVQCHLEKQKSTSLSILENRQGVQGMVKGCWDFFWRSHLSWMGCLTSPQNGEGCRCCSKAPPALQILSLRELLQEAPWEGIFPQAWRNDLTTKPTLS